MMSLGHFAVDPIQRGRAVCKKVQAGMGVRPSRTEVCVNAQEAHSSAQNMTAQSEQGHNSTVRTRT